MDGTTQDEALSDFTEVEIVGLKSASELNGKRGYVQKKVGERYAVVLDWNLDKLKSVKRKNLNIVSKAIRPPKWSVRHGDGSPDASQRAKAMARARFRSEFVVPLEDKLAEEVAAFVKKYEIREISLGFKGMFCTMPIKKHDVVLYENPVLSWDAAIRDKFNRLSPEVQEEIMNMVSTKKVVLPPHLAAQYAAVATSEMGRRFLKMLDIFATNSFERDDGTKHLYMDGTRMNHSCDPNCYVATCPAGKHINMIIALRDVDVGEELVWNYLQISPGETIDDKIEFADFAKRQRFLSSVHGFDCTCSRCSLSVADREKDETARRSFLEMMGEFDQLVIKRQTWPTDSDAEAIFLKANELTRSEASVNGNPIMMVNVVLAKFERLFELGRYDEALQQCKDAYAMIWKAEGSDAEPTRNTQQMIETHLLGFGHMF